MYCLDAQFTKSKDSVETLLTRQCQYQKGGRQTPDASPSKIQKQRENQEWPNMCAEKMRHTNMCGENTNMCGENTNMCAENTNMCAENMNMCAEKM